MTYEAEISRINPTAFVFLIDQSYSMSDPLGDGTGRKSEQLASAVNRILNDLVIRCSKGDEVFDYFEVAIIGYGNEAFGTQSVGSALGGNLKGQDFVKISTLANNPIRMEKRTQQRSDGAGGLVAVEIEFQVWLEPTFSQNTPMTAGLRYVSNLISGWLPQHQTAFPPVVIHVTDGEPTDGDPHSIAEQIRNLTTQDGNVLLFNLHLSSKNAPAIIFPNTTDRLPDEYAKTLFEMSSVLPEAWRGVAVELNLQFEPNARAFVFNADLTAMIRFVEIGTRQPIAPR